MNLGLDHLKVTADGFRVRRGEQRLRPVALNSSICNSHDQLASPPDTAPHAQIGPGRMLHRYLTDPARSTTGSSWDWLAANSQRNHAFRPVPRSRRPPHPPPAPSAKQTTHTDTDTDRDRDRDTHRDTDKDKDRQRDTHTHIHTLLLTYLHAYLLGHPSCSL